MNNKPAIALLLGLIAASDIAHAEENTKYGVTVNACSFEYDNVNFCTDKRMKAYANIIKTRSPNFDKDKIIYIFEEDKALMDIPQPYVNKYYRTVVIDPKRKTVMPAGFGVTEARDYDGNLLKVNNKGESLEFDFNINSNKFCFSGNWDQYRTGAPYHDQPYCFIYDKDEWDKYKYFSFDVLGYNNSKD